MTISFPEEIKATQEGDIITVDGKDIIAALKFLRDDKDNKYKQLIDLTAVDYPNRAKRFEVVYLLLSLHHNKRLTVKCNLEDGETIASANSVFSSANWAEREVFDLFGINFENHPDQRRILTDYGFEGNPLRKDFPLTGYKEVRYDDTQKKVIYEDVKLDQAYRSFDFESPWEGTDYKLPGDEKAS